MDAQLIFTWSLKVSLLLVLIYGAYWVLFKNNTQFQFRRALLLFSLALALATPFIEIEVPLGQIYKRTKTTSSSSPVIITEKGESMVTVKPEGKVSNVIPKKPIMWIDIITYIYLLGVIISLMMMLLEGFRLANWYYMGARRTDIKDNVITHKGIKYPFSFWKWIFVPQGTDYDQEIWEIIEKHESAHLRQGHSFDMVFSSIVQSLLWYNPIIYIYQKELKDNHEALADQSVLQFTDLKTYAKALLSVSVNANAMQLGHSFALVSTFSKRLKAMKQEQTRFQKTISSTLLLTFIVTIVTGFNVLKAQDETETREEALAVVKNRSSLNLSYVAMGNLIKGHQNLINKLKTIHPEKEITYRYVKHPRGHEYLDQYNVNQNPLYFNEINDHQKAELFEIVKTDTSTLESWGFTSSRDSKYSFNLLELINEVEKSIYENINYIIVYEPLKNAPEKIYDLSEVDTKPEPIGGLETFVTAVALDCKLPSNIKKKDLPETIDYEVVVNGGRFLTNTNLLTELEGTDEENKELYKFFGQVHNQMLDKVFKFYAWKRGVKDGKSVRVRMKIAIPTKYM